MGHHGREKFSSTGRSAAVREYCAKHSDQPSRTAAKAIFAANPGLFMNLEAARRVVRRVRGRAGVKDRLAMTNKTLYVNVPDEIPSSDNKVWLPHLVDSRVKSLLVLPDMHIPYHDERAVLAAVAYGKERAVDGVLFNGDTMDMYQISDFSRVPSRRLLVDTPGKEGEISMTRKILDYVYKKLGRPHMMFKIGNHEERLDRYIMKYCKELWGMDNLNLASQLGALQRGLVMVGDKRIIRYGKLDILHGHEYGGGFFSPVNPARSLFLKAKTNALAGHEHMSSSHSETNLKGESIACWSVGTLGDLHPDWKPLNKWNHGFAIVQRVASGNFSVENFRLINGERHPA